jgi:hypothetical protein
MGYGDSAMNIFMRRYALRLALAMSVVTSFAGGFIVRERAIADERLLVQGTELSVIARDAMRYKATPDQVAEKIRTKFHTNVNFAPANANTQANQNNLIVVLPAETGFLGMGGRWMLYLNKGADGRCETAWLELQPVGYP